MPNRATDKEFLMNRLRQFLKGRGVPHSTWLRAALLLAHLSGQLEMVFKERDENIGFQPEPTPHEEKFAAAADDFFKRAKEMARRGDGDVPKGGESRS